MTKLVAMLEPSEEYDVILKDSKGVRTIEKFNGKDLALHYPAEKP